MIEIADDNHTRSARIGYVANTHPTAITRVGIGRRRIRAATFAAVIELIHLATLVHDDSVDHSALRRGMPTINALFSHQVSVIMGDYLYSRAILELVDLDDLEPLRVLARVTNEMTVGEIAEAVPAVDAIDPLESGIEQLIQLEAEQTLSPKVLRMPAPAQTSANLQSSIRLLSPP